MSEAATFQGLPRARRGWSLRFYIMEVCLVALIVALFLLAPGFGSSANLLNVFRSVSMLGIIAFGMTAVIISGEIDLSVGSGVALAGCFAAWAVDLLTPVTGDVAAVSLGAVGALAICMACGLFTGTLRARFNVPSFITTLGLFTAMRGAANLLTDGFPLASFPTWFGFFGNGSVYGIPFPVFVFVAVFAGMHFLMSHTAFGRAVYAVGGNAEAARLSGIRVGVVKTMTFVITGGLTAISGLLIASQIGSGTGSTAAGLELDVIAAVIIGGTNLFGGRGRITGTLIGVLFLGFIGNGMTLMNVSDYWQYVVRGGLIVGAILLNQVLERR